MCHKLVPKSKEFNSEYNNTLQVTTGWYIHVEAPKPQIHTIKEPYTAYNFMPQNTTCIQRQHFIQQYKL